MNLQKNQMDKKKLTWKKKSIFKKAEKIECTIRKELFIKSKKIILN